MKTIFTIIIGLVFYGTMFCQEKTFYIEMLWQDGVFCQAEPDKVEYVDCLESLYKVLEIKKSKIISHEINTKNTFFTYKVQLIELCLFEECWKVIRYEFRTGSVSWYRISGFKENDFLHLYNNVLKAHYGGRKAADQEIAYWRRENANFNKINFDCLIKAVKKKKRECQCMISNAYLMVYEGLHVTGGEKSKEYFAKYQLFDRYYSYFSNRPYQGFLPPKN